MKFYALAILGIVGGLLPAAAIARPDWFIWLTMVGVMLPFAGAMTAEIGRTKP